MDIWSVEHILEPRVKVPLREVALDRIIPGCPEALRFDDVDDDEIFDSQHEDQSVLAMETEAALELLEDDAKDVKHMNTFIDRIMTLPSPELRQRKMEEIFDRIRNEPFNAQVLQQAASFLQVLATRKTPIADSLEPLETTRKGSVAPMIDFGSVVMRGTLMTTFAPLAFPLESPRHSSSKPLFDMKVSRKIETSFLQVSKKLTNCEKVFRISCMFTGFTNAAGRLSIRKGSKRVRGVKSQSMKCSRRFPTPKR